MDDQKKHQLSIYVTPDEEQKVRRIQQYFGRNTVSDTFRKLINDADEKILKENVATANQTL